MLLSQQLSFKALRMGFSLLIGLANPTVGFPQLPDWVRDKIEDTKAAGRPTGTEQETYIQCHGTIVSNNRTNTIFFYGLITHYPKVHSNNKRCRWFNQERYQKGHFKT